MLNPSFPTQLDYFGCYSHRFPWFSHDFPMSIPAWTGFPWVSSRAPGGYRNGLNLRAVADQVPGPVVVVGTEGNVGTWPVPPEFRGVFHKGKFSGTHGNTLDLGGFNQPLWKMMEWVTVGMMTFHSQLMWKVIKAMSQSPPTSLGSSNMVLLREHHRTSTSETMDVYS